MTIITHNSERVLVATRMSETDRARLGILARSFRARYVPAFDGWAMYPSVAAKVEALFEAGYCAGWREGDWRFGLHGEALRLRRHEAVRLAREAVCR